MSAVNLAAVMDGIGAQILASGLARNVYSWPVRTVVTPCALVDYPTSIRLSETFQRGTDRVTLPVLFLVDADYTQAARDALSALIAGGSDLVAAIEGSYAYGDIQVVDAEPTTVVVGETTYLGLKLTVDVQT